MYQTKEVTDLPASFAKTYWTLNDSAISLEFELRANCVPLAQRADVLVQDRDRYYTLSISTPVTSPWSSAHEPRAIAEPMLASEARGSADLPRGVLPSRQTPSCLALNLLRRSSGFFFRYSRLQVGYRLWIRKRSASVGGEGMLGTRSVKHLRSVD